ncbi:MAG: hypothetical protein ACTSVK_17990 [Promethearchaeota archaeon]
MSECKPSPFCVNECMRSEPCPHPRVIKCSYCGEIRECVERYLDTWVCAVCMNAILKQEYDQIENWKFWIIDKLNALDSKVDRLAQQRNKAIQTQIDFLDDRFELLQKQMELVIKYFESKTTRRKRRK